MSIKDMVMSGRMVHFLYYKTGELWYVTDCGFQFPVPISDTGDAEFCVTDKAMLFMRWIRKHKQNIDMAKIEQGVNNEL